MTVPAQRVFVVAGEPSGDLHAANLVRELLDRRPEVQVEAYGMDALEQAGANVVFDMRDLAVMWFAAVIARLPTFVHLIYRTFRDWRDRPPSAIVLVDYPGLNLLLARYAKRRGIPVVYYIPPQLWAWAPWRRRQLARRTDRVLTVLPFEAAFLADGGAEASFVGHPLGDEEWPEYAPEPGHVLLMPGSRTKEIDAHLDLFLATARRIAAGLEGARFTLVAARDKHRERIDTAVAASGLDITVVPAASGRAAMSRAWVALAKSGTTTLELGLAGVPTVIAYRISPLARVLGRMHMTSPYIGLINVVAGEEIAPEHLLATDDDELLAREVLELASDGDRRQRAREGARRVREVVARPGSAARAAEAVLEVLGSEKDGCG